MSKLHHGKFDILRIDNLQKNVQIDLNGDCHATGVPRNDGNQPLLSIDILWNIFLYKFTDIIRFH